MAGEDSDLWKGDHLVSKNSDKICDKECVIADGDHVDRVCTRDKVNILLERGYVTCVNGRKWAESRIVVRGYRRQAMVSTAVVGLEGGRSQQHQEDGSRGARPVHAKQLVTGAWNPSLRLESAASLTPTDRRVWSYDRSRGARAAHAKQPVTGA